MKSIPQKIPLLLTISIMLISVLLVKGQLLVHSVNTPYTISFDETTPGVNNGTFEAEGFAPNPSNGQIDSDGIRVRGFSDGDLPFGGLGVSGDFARGIEAGKTNKGGIYAFKVNNNNFTLGAKPTNDDFSAGDYTLLAINKSTMMIDSIVISYDIWVLNTRKRSHNFNFSWSKTDVHYHQVPSLDYSSPVDKDNFPVWQKHSRSKVIEVNLNAGDSLFLKWTGSDNGGVGSGGDQLGIDNITIVFQNLQSLLPVEWISFNTQIHNDGVMLQWKTTNELNSSHFVVQHSTNGSQWTNTGKVDAKSSKEDINSYTFLHNQAEIGRNYYRLKEVGRDGQLDYSKIQYAVYCGEDLQSLEIYPNPVRETLNISYPYCLDYTDIIIYQREGIKMMEIKNNETELSVGHLPKGLYYIYFISQEGDEQMIPFVKQ